MATKEIYILGAGIFGLASAFWLIRAGARVTIIDPEGIGKGASGGFIGALCPHSPDSWNAKKAFQFESLRMSEVFWRQVEEISGHKSGYARTGRIIPLMSAHALELAEARQQDARKNWQNFAEWNIAKLAELRVFMGEGISEWAVFENLSAHIHPRRALAALGEAIRKMGGEFSPCWPKSAPPTARQLWAMGYRGLSLLETELNRSVGNGVKGQALLFEANHPNHPQLFIDGVHFIPHLGGGLGVGSTSERLFTSPDKPDEKAQELYDKALAIMPALKRYKLLARWAGVRPRAITRAPLIDRHPMRENIYIANGGFKIGFGIAPKVGELVAALMLEGKDKIPEAFKFSALARVKSG